MFTFFMPKFLHEKSNLNSIKLKAIISVSDEDIGILYSQQMTGLPHYHLKNLLSRGLPGTATETRREPRNSNNNHDLSTTINKTKQGK